jgi:hypothetical protein
MTFGRGRSETEGGGFRRVAAYQELSKLLLPDVLEA